jgi:hypothetical protein
MMNRAVYVVGLGVLALMAARGASAQHAIEPVSVGGGGAAASHPTRSSAECVGVVAPADSAPGDSTWHPAQLTQMVVPPTQGLPSSMRGRTTSVRFLIGVYGSPDSIDIKGPVDRDYLPRLTASLMEYRFRPAIFQGCLVRACGSLIALSFR